MQDIQFKEVLFVYYSPLLDQTVEELLWCKLLDPKKNHFELQSVPFYGPDIACGDIIEVKKSINSDDLHFDQILSRSGNSILQLIIEKANPDFAKCLSKLKQLDCRIEKATEHLYAVSIHKIKNYLKIYQCILPYVQAELIDFAEAHLSKKHQKDLRKGGYQV